jgi:hypothetical protein
VIRPVLLDLFVVLASLVSLPLLPPARPTEPSIEPLDVLLEYRAGRPRIYGSVLTVNFIIEESDVDFLVDFPPGQVGPFADAGAVSKCQPREVRIHEIEKIYAA